MNFHLLSLFTFVSICLNSSYFHCWFPCWIVFCILLFMYTATYLICWWILEFLCSSSEYPEMGLSSFLGEGITGQVHYKALRRHCHIFFLCIFHKVWDQFLHLLGLSQFWHSSQVLGCISTTQHSCGDFFLNLVTQWLYSLSHFWWMHRNTRGLTVSEKHIAMVIITQREMTWCTHYQFLLAFV